MTKQANNNKVYSDKLCGECGQPLLKMPWGKNGEITLLVCNNMDCRRDRQPQGTEVVATDFRETGEIGAKTP